MSATATVSVRCPDCQSILPVALPPLADLLAAGLYEWATGLDVGLTPLEAAIVEVLHASPGRVVAMETIHRSIHGGDWDPVIDAHPLRQHISRLRPKLARAGWWVASETGIGFRLLPQGSAARGVAAGGEAT